MSKNSRGHLHARHKLPLPLDNVVPLPAVTFSNPLSVLDFFYAWLFPNTQSSPLNRSSQGRRLRCRLEKSTRSCWVEDAFTKEALWASGFFGKGCFSRSELSWYTRTQRQLGVIGINERLTAEEITARRRVLRRKMKAERARSEQEALFKTLQEEGRITHTAVENKEGPELDSDGEIVQEEDDKAQTQFVPEKGSITNYIPDREHMQLTLEEGLFLADVLDVLDVYDGDSLLPRDQLLETFDSLATGRSAGIAFSDSPFLIRYAAYHHYRSLGWTPRAGIKFGVDLLLYHRGPVFSHAEFAVKLVPTVHVSGQEADAGRSAPWHWLHTISRVNGQAKKTLVLTYIEVDHRTIDLSKTSTMDMLALYRIREASFRRFIPSRSRD